MIECSDPHCRACKRRRWRRDLLLTAVMSGAVTAFLLAVLLFLLEVAGVYDRLL